MCRAAIAAALSLFGAYLFSVALGLRSNATSSLIQVLDQHKGSIDTQLRPMLSKLALHILAKCGFGKGGSRLQELKSSEEPHDDHKLSFADTFLGIDQDLPLIALTPPVVLNNSPLQVHKRGRTLKSEMQKCLLEAIEQKRGTIKKAKTESKNLLDFLVEAGDNDGLLSREQIMGNIFILHFESYGRTVVRVLD